MQLTGIGVDDHGPIVPGGDEDVAVPGAAQVAEAEVLTELLGVEQLAGVGVGVGVAAVGFEQQEPVVAGEAGPVLAGHRAVQPVAVVGADLFTLAEDPDLVGLVLHQRGAPVLVTDVDHRVHRLRAEARVR